MSCNCYILNFCLRQVGMNFSFDYCSNFRGLKISLTHLFFLGVFILLHWFLSKAGLKVIFFCKRGILSWHIRNLNVRGLVFWGRGRRNININCIFLRWTLRLLWFWVQMHVLVDNTINRYLLGEINIGRRSLVALMVTSRSNFVIKRVHFYYSEKNNKFINYTIWSEFLFLNSKPDKAT